MQTKNFSPDHYAKAGRRAFTLLELFVVIAIIGALIALLFPVFSRVSNQSKMAECTSNLRAIGTAAHLYASEHNGKLPGILFTANSEEEEENTHAGQQWDAQIMPYLGMDTHHPASDTKTPFYCPASTLLPGHPLSRQLSYAWNARLNEAFDSKRLSNLEHPSTILLATDNKIHSDRPDMNTLTFGSARNTIYIVPRSNKLKRVAYERHNGRVNVLFADGSVAARSPVDPPDAYNTPSRVRFFSGDELSD